MLHPMTMDDREEFYELATTSYGSRYWYDRDRKKKPRFKQEFFADWHPGYFDSSKPEIGQCYWIVADGKRIGQINFNAIDQRNKNVEIDIIIGAESDLGKGYGTDAIKTLVKHLFRTVDLHKVFIEARANNPRAVAAYEKAGFVREGLLRDQDYFEGKFGDCVRFGILRDEIAL